MWIKKKIYCVNKEKYKCEAIATCVSVGGRERAICELKKRKKCFSGDEVSVGTTLLTEGQIFSQTKLRFIF
jgi:hypothetical protein